MHGIILYKVFHVHLLRKHYYAYHIVQNGGGENFGEFGESGVIRQSFTHPNLHAYIIKLQVASMINE